MKQAERIVFQADEDGWEMHVTDENGFVTRFNIHAVAWDLVDQMNDSIGDWRREGLAAVGLSGSPASSQDDLTATELKAYAPGSPKWLTLTEADVDLARDQAREAGLT